MQIQILSAIFFLALTSSQHIGEFNETAADILVRPKQPKAIDILCAGKLSSNRTGVMKDYSYAMVMGDVAGGESALYYARNIGCYCNG
ncbi:MAG: hypothetical protein Q9199_004909 [Rusavskia elegans]